MDKKGASSTKILWNLRKDTHLLDEFCYEADEVKCHCNLRASRLISRTEANPQRKLFGCPLYNSPDAQGCGFFLWYDSKIQQDMHNLTTMVGNLTLQLRRVQEEKKELESTLERVIVGSSTEECDRYVSHSNEAYIVHELGVIKERLARLEDVVFFNQ